MNIEMIGTGQGLELGSRQCNIYYPSIDPTTSTGRFCPPLNAPTTFPYVGSESYRCKYNGPNKIGGLRYYGTINCVGLAMDDANFQLGKQPFSAALKTSCASNWNANCISAYSKAWGGTPQQASSIWSNGRVSDFWNYCVLY
jgi:hypothetical protein